MSQIDKHDVQARTHQPSPDEQKYHRISEAATLLDCTPDQVLQMGIARKILISAPVIAGGRYEWPIGCAMLPFRELTDTFIFPFSTRDRVYLIPADLEHLQSVGWVVPKSFLAPERARQAIENFGLFDLPQKKDEAACDDISGDVIPKLLPKDETNDQLREQAFWTRWSAELLEEENCGILGQNRLDAKSAERTSMTHLFVEDVEVLRLKREATAHRTLVQTDEAPVTNETPAAFIRQGKIEDEEPPTEAPKKPKNKKLPFDEKEPNGYTERWAGRQRDVLKAAIYCKKHFPEQCINNPAWAKTIEIKAAIFWRLGTPPLKYDGILRLLRDIDSYPKL